MKGIAGFWVFVGLLALAGAASAQDALEVDHAVEQLMNMLTTPVEMARQAELEERRRQQEQRRQNAPIERARRLQKEEMERQFDEERRRMVEAPEIAVGSHKSLKQRETTEMGRLIEILTASGEGKVIQVGETGVLFIQLDRQGGLTEGSQVELMRPKLPVRVDDERVGSDEESLGTARITKLIRDKALARMAGNAKGIAKPGDKIYAADRKTKRLVVASFTYNNDLTEFSISLQEKLITALVNKGLKVVERSQLEKVIMEQKFSYSGLIDLNSAQQVGKLLGAVGMLLGTITDEGNAVAVNARLVEVRTADILTAAEVELAKTPLIAQKLEKIITASGVSVRDEDSEPDQVRNRLLGRLKSLGYDTENIVKKNLPLSQVQTDYDIFIRRVATKQELPEFLEEISNLGTKNGLTFELFKPLSTKVGYFYQLKPLKIIVRAKTSQLEQFISSLSTLPKLISLYKQADFLCQQPSIIKAELVLVFPYFEDTDKLSVNESGYHFAKLDGIPDLPNQKFTCISNPTP